MKSLPTLTTLQGLHLHLDPVSGIAGDMTVAALVDAGVPPSVVTDAVAAIGVPGVRVRFDVRRRGAFVGRGFVVEEAGSTHGVRRSGRAGPSHQHVTAPAHAPKSARHASAPHDHATGARHHLDHGANDHHHHRNYADIRGLIARAKLNAETKALAQDIFERLAQVEAALHGSSIERVTFHEVGAVDSIADIVGMAAALTWLAPASIGSSPPVLGTGTVKTAHGIVAVPAPATTALLRGVPVISEGQGELTTPTGAVFLATVVDSFGAPPPMRLAAVGYGAGNRELADRANVLRVMLGEPIGQSLKPAASNVVVLEANIDDMSGQFLSALFDALFVAGALDVWSTAIVMKKGRPAHQVSAMVEPVRARDVERAFFLNSTTLGVRLSPVARVTLARSVAQVSTIYGPVRIKVGGLDGAPITAAPEYDDCRRLAATAGVPVQKVWTAATVAAATLTAVGSGTSVSGKTRRTRGKTSGRSR
jgi:uncharacterized protein (TIGR00299 family) protein